MVRPIRLIGFKGLLRRVHLSKSGTTHENCASHRTSVSGSLADRKKLSKDRQKLLRRSCFFKQASMHSDAKAKVYSSVSNRELDSAGNTGHRLEVLKLNQFNVVYQRLQPHNDRNISARYETV